MSESSIGIYLGLKNACIGTYQNNSIKLIPSELGKIKIPLIVSFSKGKILVGESAKGKMENEPKNTIYEIRKLIGKNYDDPDVQKLIKEVPYIIKKDSKTNKPIIIVEYYEDIKSYSPEQIYVIILQKLIEISLRSINEIKNIVITIPTYFNDFQRKSIENECKIAGLDVKLIEESIAACLAYNNNKLNTDKIILVFSMGSCELNLSIVQLNNSLFKIISNGHYKIGGDDFDNELVNFCIKQFQNETGYDIRNNKKSIKRLKNECKRVKEELSLTVVSAIDIDNLFNDESFYLEIMRAHLENELEELFNKCVSFIDNILKDSYLNKNQINEIIFAGGSTNIPKLQEKIKYHLNIGINFSINPKEVYSYGATFLANNNNINVNDLSPKENEPSNFTEDNEIIEQSNLSSENDINSDFIPLSLGIDKGDGIMEVIFSRNTKFLVKIQFNFILLKTMIHFVIFMKEKEN